MAPISETWGAKRDTAVTLPCDEHPLSGHAITVGPGNVASAARTLEGRAIANQAISSNHLSRAIRDLVFAGGGFDGEADFDDSGATVLGIAPTGGVGARIYTLTRDIAPSRMQIRAGVTVRPKGFKIFARELHLWGSAIIHADGGVGASTTTAAKAAGGSPVLDDLAAIILGGGADGGTGGQGGELASEAGDPGGSPDAESIMVGLGGDGEVGSVGETVGGGGAGGAAGAGGTVGGTEAHSASLDNATRLMRGVSLIGGGAGGGGGGGGGATGAGADGGGGGGGGAGGGVLMLAVGLLSLHSWTGRISANGGLGGDGAAGAGAAGDGGRGSGGGGGVVHLLYAEIEGGALVPMPHARNTATITQAARDASGCNVTAWGGGKGTTGSGIPPQSSATIAPCGTVRVVGPEPFVHPAEMPPARQPTRPFYPPRRLHAGHYESMRRSVPS